MAVIRPFLTSLLLRATKGLLGHPSDPGETLTSYFGGGKSSTGVTVTPDSSMRASAVYACVRILAESIASLPLIMYRRVGDDGRERAKAHPLYPIVHSSPNDDQTSFEFRETLQNHLALRGNAYAFIDWSFGGRVKQLIPLDPDRMTVRRDKGKIVYEYQYLDNSIETFSSEEILHLKGLSSDGIMGLSPIDMAREAIGLALATEEYGGRFFSNNTHIGTYLTSPNKLDEQRIKNIKDSVDRQHGGLFNSHKIAVFENGVEPKRINMTAEDAQFIESRKFQLNEIARIFRIPPHMIGDLEKATFSNIEQQSIDFVTHSIRPWLVRWEQRLTKSLLAPHEQAEYFFEFNLDGLLRGEALKRAQALQIMRQNGALNADEWRAKENMNPIGGEEGTKYWQNISVTRDEKSEEDPEPQPANN